jgi:N-acetylglutamate synthase-like GNAT family acetyltransferase
VQPGPYRTRRATTDDLEQLKALWEEARFPVLELEKQFTDFQVAADGEGRVAAAIAIQIAGHEGHIHSETYADFGLTDALRPRLWQHLQVVAQNHSLFRVWTTEAAPFWRRDAGFAEAPSDVLAKFPAAFGTPGPRWLALRLRDEAAEPEALARQFEVFKIAEQEKRDKVLRHARALRFLGTFLAALLFISLFALLLYFYHHR